ncbi:hypothetical protein T484DRAFT_2781759 [Baffinella frigidus]|nr:hypothetical protein T484DRAFT_2781759 [Cryptophyta sp. CCMP2293]
MVYSLRCGALRVVRLENLHRIRGLRVRNSGPEGGLNAILSCTAGTTRTGGKRSPVSVLRNPARGLRNHARRRAGPFRGSGRASCRALPAPRLNARVFRIWRARVSRISRAQGCGRASCHLGRTVRVVSGGELRESWSKGEGGEKGRGGAGEGGSIRTFSQLQLRGQFRYVGSQTSFNQGGEVFSYVPDQLHLRGQFRYVRRQKASLRSCAEQQRSLSVWQPEFRSRQLS